MIELTLFLQINLFFILFDETTDITRRPILHIMAQVLDETAQNPKLIASVNLNQTNSDEIAHEINLVVGRLIKHSHKGHLFKALLSDGAPYCRLVGVKLKRFFPNLMHIICICHNIHLLCESIRQKYDNVNTSIVEMKRLLNKNQSANVF